MSIGERLFRLRTEKNLSQGDLAEMLGISRQSISKWENNLAVPDLDKIVRLSEIFEVSIDEIVKGKTLKAEYGPDSETEAKKAPEQSRIDLSDTQVHDIKQEKRECGFTPRKIAGTILLCMAFFLTVVFLAMGGGVAGFLFSIPFLVCGSICFAFKKNVGLWWTWAVYILIDVYIVLATGIRRSSILLTLKWTTHWNFARLAFAWIMVIGLAVIVAITVMRFRNIKYKNDKAALKSMIVAWVIVLVLWVLSRVWGNYQIYTGILAYILPLQSIYTLISFILEWLQIVAFTVSLTNTVRFFRGR